MRLHRIVVAAAAVAVAACGVLPQPGEPDAEARAAALAGADWSRMIDVSIEMHDHGYSPREIRLRAGQPYRLRLYNTGGVAHYFTAPEFFASVAARKAEVPRQAELKAATFTSFELFGRGGTLDFYFIPLVPGTYRAHCHIKDHLPLGIEGMLIVE